MVAYFFDTYALIEIEKGNKDYKPYTKAEIITTKLNLIEFYNSLLVDFNQGVADRKFEVYVDNCVPVMDEDIKNGVKLRIQMRNKNKLYKSSFVDCIGYVLALRFGIKFLTGDNAFKDLDNVEFMK